MKFTNYISNRDIYEKVILEQIPKAKKFVWIATADVKDLYVQKEKRFVPFLQVLSELIKKGISIRILYAKEPGPAFRKDFDKYPLLIKNLEKMLCPRNHMKMIIVDGIFAYLGSANLTGAGLGAKKSENRNFESGIITNDNKIVEPMMKDFDEIWMGLFCRNCNRKSYCLDPLIHTF
ncbi:MAG: phospholipase [Candidatus Cloacimonas sp. 4484_275]|nr:MAG: phospholipase [Candidatus Cloacimonas sp. 4484_275]